MTALSKQFSVLIRADRIVFFHNVAANHMPTIGTTTRLQFVYRYKWVISWLRCLSRSILIFQSCTF